MIHGNLGSLEPPHYRLAESENSETSGTQNGHRTSIHIQLYENPPEVRFHCLGGNAEFAGSSAAVHRGLQCLRPAIHRGRKAARDSHTASRLFNRKGVDSTSLEEIAAGIRTTKRALYCHVGDKQALLAVCYRRSYEIFLHLLGRPNESDTSCLYRLTAYTKRHRLFKYATISNHSGQQWVTNPRRNWQIGG
jgi:hypothetical protein